MPTMRLLAGGLLVGLSIACHPSAPPSPIASPYGGKLITADQIAATGATNVWDVLKAEGLGLKLDESWDGIPVAIESGRGHSSIVLNTNPLVFVDGIQLSDIRFLLQIPAADIQWIRQLTGIEATAKYGTNAGNGVILIASKS